MTYNWPTSGRKYVGEHALPPLGVLVESDDGSLIAGILSVFNGEDLAGTVHYLIQETEIKLITIKHYFGDHTPIKIEKPLSWTNANQIIVKAVTSEGEHEIAASVDTDSIRSTISYTVSGDMEYQLPVMFD